MRLADRICSKVLEYAGEPAEGERIQYWQYWYVILKVNYDCLLRSEPDGTASRRGIVDSCPRRPQKGFLWSETQLPLPSGRREVPVVRKYMHAHLNSEP